MGMQQEWFLWEERDSEEDRRHRPMREENAFWHAVTAGDLEAVRQNCRQQRFTADEGVGVLSRDPVTHLKYHFVITAALITRLCVREGMEMEQAFRLSDFYIRKLDGILTIQGVAGLHDQMVLDFTGKMRMLSKNSGASKPVTDCIDYVYVHIQERITIDDLAAHTGFSASHLSRMFKRETGVSISDYIREKKIEKAQDLLKYTEYSLIEVANRLSFSSQSHFTQQFRAFTGMTPKKYRDLYICGKLPGMEETQSPSALA